MVVNIGETVVHGVAFDLKNNEKVVSMDLNQLYATVERLFDLLEEQQVDYVLVGGIAMLAYVEGRNTQDVDLLLSRDAVRNIPGLIVEDENQEFLRARLSELQIDVLLTSNKLFAQVASNYATRQTFAEREVHCATPEGLVLLKLFALPSLYRQGQLAKAQIYEGDIAALIASQNVAAEHLLEDLEAHLSPSDVTELHRIVADIRSRQSQAKDRFKG